MSNGAIAGVSYDPMRIATTLVPLAVVLLASGCGTLSNGRSWGEDATLTPGWERVKEAAWNAARSPRVWVPLAGAALVQIDDWDRDIADWAREETPIFGSVDNAERWSDDLETTSKVAFHVTALATPSGDTPRDWIGNKLRGYAVDVAAIGVTTGLTRTLKDAVGRERPNGEDDRSFPSGHAAVAAVHNRLASRNLQSIDMNRGGRRALDAGLDALTVGTSWARIEAGWHYPSDTLFSASLGAFFAAFFNDAFMGLGGPDSPSMVLVVNPGGASMQFGWRR